jgi:hypothetical protein
LSYAEVHPVFAGTANSIALRAQKPGYTRRSFFLVEQSGTMVFASEDVFGCKATSDDDRAGDVSLLTGTKP